MSEGFTAPAEGEAGSHDPLLPLVYAAALDPGRWPEVLGRVVAFMGGHRGILFSHEATPEQGGLWVQHAMTEAWAREYAERFHAHDVWMQRGHALGVFVPGRVVVSDALLPRSEFLASVFYREFLVRQDVNDLCAGILHDGAEPNVPIVHIAVYRSGALPAFGERDKARMRALIPHLQQATRIGFRMGAADAELRMLSTVAGTIARPLLLLDEQGRVIFANAPARGVLDARDGLELVDDRLVVAARQRARLALFLGHRAGTGESMLRVRRPSGRRDYWLMRVPIAEARETVPDSRRACVAVMVHDPEDVDSVNVTDFSAAYGLTPAESRLVQALSEHGALPAAASATGRSVNTLRAQLRSVLDKTGARRQTELLRMLASWPQRFVRDEGGGTPD